MAAGVVVAAVLVSMVTSPNWQPLYTNLTPSEAGQITNQLAQMKVPYELSQGGRTVLVPRAQVDQTRVALADQNIPSRGTVGFANVTQFSLGETDQQLQVTQQLALQDELASTIASINAVTGAKVFLNESTPSLFGTTTTPPTASVFVQLKPYQTLSSGQVRGIMNLVAHAVPGLTPSNVTVVDQTGAVLSAAVVASTNTATGPASSELSAEQAYSNQIQQSVQSLLTQVLGPGAAAVRVTSVLSFASQSVSSINYGKGVLSQQQTTVNKSAGTTGAVAAGTTANTPGYTAAAGTPTSASGSSTIQKYLVNQTKTTTTTPPGTVQRLTVAVAVNKALSPAQLTSLKALVAQAAGINPARGDQLTVVGVPFNTAAAVAATKAIAQAQRTTQYTRWAEEGVLALLGVLLLLSFYRGLKRWQTTRAQMPDRPLGSSSEEMNQSVASLLQQLNHSRGEPTQGDVAMERVAGLVGTDASNVARILRTWMVEEDG